MNQANGIQAVCQGKNRDNDNQYLKKRVLFLYIRNTPLYGCLLWHIILLHHCNL